MRKVFIIAGHNGPHTGATGYIDEGAETIVFRDLLDEELCTHNIVAHVDADASKLTGVVNMIKKEAKKEDICIDIHFNASTNSSATGVECLVSSGGDIERALAADICSTVSSTLGIRNRGVKGESSGHHSTLAMLSSFRCEQMILEICFCTNKSDCDRYNSYKKELAKKISDLIFKYAQK